MVIDVDWKLRCGLNFNKNFVFLREKNDDLSENKNNSNSDTRCPALKDCKLE